MSSNTYLYAGCYTRESPQAIRVFRTQADGSFVQTSAVDSIEDASFLAAHPHHPILYAVSETDSFGSGATGGVHAFRIGQDGSLQLFAETASLGIAPCHVSVDPAGNRLFVANYVSGSFAAYDLDANGTFGELIGCHHNHGDGPSTRQDGPHAHCIVPGPDSEDGTTNTYGVDLGTDRITQFRDAHADEDQRLVAAGAFELAAGAGPRHIVFHPDRPLAFVACELNSTLVMVSVDPFSGELRQIEEHATIPEDFQGASTVAEVGVHPEGGFVYVSNRGHDSIAIFALAPHDPTLRLVDTVPTAGRNPRHFRIDRSGKTLLVANEESNSIVPFDLDPRTGMLQQRDDGFEAVSPVCLSFGEVV